MLATKTKNLLFADILTISRKNMENFDAENLSGDEKQQYSLMKKMYNSSYIMLLRNGLSFYTNSDSWKEADSVFLSINGEVYDFSVSQMKNLLGKKEAEDLLSQSFSSEQKDYVFDTEKTKRLNISRYMSLPEKEEAVKQDASEKQTLKEEPVSEEKEEKEAPVLPPFPESEGAAESPPKKKKKKKKKKHPAEAPSSEETLSDEEEKPEEKEEPLAVETFIEEETTPVQESVKSESVQSVSPESIKEPAKEAVKPESVQSVSPESVKEPVKEVIKPDPVRNTSPESVKEPVKEVMKPDPVRNTSPESVKEPVKEVMKPESVQSISSEPVEKSAKPVKESVKLDISALQKKGLASEREERKPELSSYPEDEKAYARQTAAKEAPEKERLQKDSYESVLSGRKIRNLEEEKPSEKDSSKENREKPRGFSMDETFEDVMPGTKPSASPVSRTPKRARASAPSVFEEPEEQEEETSYKTDEDHFIDITELLMDSFKIKVFSIDDKEKKTPLETFTIVAAPLKEGKDNAFLPIFSYAASKSSVSAMASLNSTRPSYEIQLDENVFMIRGKWNADGFSTILYPQNFFNKETQTEKKVFRPASQSIGHNINILEDSLKMHVLPISSKNEKSGNVNILVCLEDTKNDKFIPAFSDAETSVATVVYNKKTYAVTASWKGRQLISGVEVK